MRAGWLWLGAVGCAGAEPDPGPELAEAPRDTSSASTSAQETLPPEGFAFPGADPSAFSTTSRIGVDHDPEVQEEGLAGSVVCSDYLGRPFPHCYDEHHGTDYILDGGFPAMDAGSTAVVAAADGVVTFVEEGQYDRCHASGGAVDCDGHPMVKNEVTVAHEDGLVTRYWHLLKDSVPVEVGDRVSCGDVLGLVGSSGNSSMPHLHFQVERASGEWVDPYADPDGAQPPLWAVQGPDLGLPGSCGG